MEFDTLLGIHVVIHKYIYRMWCKHKQLPSGPLTTVPRSDDPGWRGRHILPEGGASAERGQIRRGMAKYFTLIIMGNTSA